MTPQELRASILQQAIQGKLVEQRPEEGTGEELFQQIQAEKQELIKASKIKRDKGNKNIAKEDIPFDIPDTWKWVCIQDLFNVRSAMRIHQTDWQTSGIPFFRGRELVQLAKTGTVDFDIYISRELYEENKAKGGVPQKDDILISAVGTLGKVYVVKGTHEFYYKDAYILCFENIGKMYPHYIKYALESPYSQAEIRRDSMATTVAQLTIIKAKQLLIPLPPVEEQKRIVAKLEEILPLIDLYETAWNKLDAFNKRFPGDMQKSILQLAIQGKLVEQRPEEGTGAELFQQIQAEKQALIKAGKIKKEKPLPKVAEEELPFDIPNTWKWIRLGSVIDMLPGFAFKSSDFKKEGKYRLLRGINLSVGNTRWDDTVYVNEMPEKCQAFQILQGDVLIGLDRPWISDGIRVAIYDGDENTYLVQRVLRIRETLAVTKEYIALLLRSNLFRNAVEGETTGISVPHISPGQVGNVVVPLPPLAEQKRIVAKLEEILPLCERLK